MKNRGFQNRSGGGGARTLQPAPSPHQRTLARGLAHHQAGRLAEAEADYRQVLGAEPGNASALHLLGVLANQCGQPEAAVALISQAVAIEPLAASYHNNLGVAYQNLQRLEEAAGCYEKALTIQPDHVDALNNQGVVLQALGQLEGALQSFEHSLKLRPNSHETLNNVGSLLARQGRLEEAELRLRRSLKLKPGYPEALITLAGLHLQRDELAEALASCAQAVAAAPADARAYDMQGTVLQRAGRLDEALASYAKALVIQPDHVDAMNNQGVVLQALGRLEEALQSFERSLKLRPDSPETLNNVGLLLSKLGRTDEAQARLRRALELQPGYLDALLSLAALQLECGQLTEALATCDRAVAAAPTDGRIYDMRGTVLREAGRLDEAIASYEDALVFSPAVASLWLNLAAVLQVAGRMADALKAYHEALALDPTSASAHSGLIFSLDLTHGAADEARAERARWNEQFGQAWRQHSPTFTNSRETERPLRVGYVSADFYDHSAAMLFMPILRAHDRAQMQVYCYSGSTRSDAVTAEARALADVWHDVALRTDDQLEALIRTDEIDVLVDLSGHTAGNRLPVFARKPAPIQVTAWGYATGTGLDAMDGFLVDRVVAPPEEDDRYAERIVPLPSTICFEPPLDAPAVDALPALSRGYVTFGSFNRLPKVSAETRAAWAQVLKTVPTARLLVKTGAQASASMRQQLLDDLVGHGISRERIEIRAGSSRVEHLATHNEVDLVLDSFPHGGGVTTVEALLMGAPVVTLLGEGVAGRLSASFVTALGLGELVATTTDEYVEIAQATAGRLEWLAEQRSTLRERLLASPTGDTRAYTRAVEDAYRGLWRAWCARPSA